MFRKAKSTDLDKIKLFIHENWAENHVLSKSDKLIKWQHLNNNGDLNFIISLDKNDNIDGLFGFIPLAHFDEEIDNGHYWGALWKSTNKIIPSHGWQLIRYFTKVTNSNFLGLIGINSVSKSIYEKLRLPIGQLKHYYFPNESICSPSIGSYKVEKRFEKYSGNNTWNVSYINGNDADFTDQKLLPFKSTKYYYNRYVDHPFYEYKFIEIYNREQHLILIGREQKVNNSKCFNIVDISGEIEYLKGADIGPILHQFIKAAGYEYLDLQYFGPHNEIISTELGFIEKDDTKEIIPIYFEPFVKANKTIFFAIQGLDNLEGISIFKGDGDQDRPNTL